MISPAPLVTVQEGAIVIWRPGNAFPSFELSPEDAYFLVADLQQALAEFEP